MKGINKISIILLILLSISSCKKENDLPPLAITDSATEITNTTVILNGSVTPNKLSTSVSFEYGLTTEYGKTINAVQNDISGTFAIPVTSNVTDLISGEEYHFRTKAVNSAGTVYGDDKEFITSVKDVDGNIYSTVKIGTQTWMVENLKTTKLKDGTAIPVITGNSQWQNLSTPGLCAYNNDETANKNIYGLLYNYFAASDIKLSPAGWHVPSDSEWESLANFLIANGFNYDGTTSDNKIGKSLAGSGWAPISGTGVVGAPDFPEMKNLSGFTALPGGFRFNTGTFYYLGSVGTFWTNTEDPSNINSGLYRSLSSSTIYLNAKGAYKTFGYSVRCLRN